MRFTSEASSTFKTLWVCLQVCVLFKWSVYDAILMDLLTYPNKNSFHLMGALKKTIKHQFFVSVWPSKSAAVVRRVSMCNIYWRVCLCKTNGENRRAINANSAWQTVHKSGLRFVSFFDKQPLCLSENIQIKRKQSPFPLFLSPSNCNVCNACEWQMIQPIFDTFIYPKWPVICGFLRFWCMCVCDIDLMGF